MTHLIKFDVEKSNVQLLSLENSGYKILDESSIPKTYIHAPYLAIIKGAYLAIKNNIRVYKMEGWNAQISAKVDEWFGKSFPLKFKYSSKDIQFWIKSSQELMDKSFLTNGWELLEKAIIFIFGAIDRIYIDNPEAIKIEVTKLNYYFDIYNSNKKIEEQFDEYNLFSDASVREFDKVATIAGLIKNQKNEILTVYRSKVDYKNYSDSNLTEMLAITEGLKVALDMGIKNIKIFTDSMCAIEKLQKYSPYYRGLFSENVEMMIKYIKAFNECKFVHINRHHNKLADEMTHF